MVPLKDILAFAGVAVVLVAVPGPSVVFTISRALTSGRRTALLNVVGNTIGLVVQVVAAAFGLGAVIERSAAVFTGVKLAGAAYLVWLGVQAIRHRRSLTETIAAEAGPLSPLRAVRDGVVVGATNPKTIAVFLVVMPQFVARDAGHVASQLLVLGLVFPLIALVLDSCWALAAGTARQWLSSSPRRLAAIGGAGGLVMIGLGVSLAATGRKD
ncbi:MAG: LysE family translocator [Actinomycetota bacterium]|nr:LysE family translocator [Actinomycetota bacterium]MDA8359349.1 LysE family translocator [Actinomycetota bacterium]